MGGEAPGTMEANVREPSDQQHSFFVLSTHGEVLATSVIVLPVHRLCTNAKQNKGTRRKSDEEFIHRGKANTTHAAAAVS